MESIVRPKCPDCPLRDDPDHACPGQTRTYERYCFLVGPDGGPNAEGYRQIVIKRALHQTDGFAIPRGAVSLAVPKAETTPGHQPTPPEAIVPRAVSVSSQQAAVADPDNSPPEESPDMRRTHPFDLQKIVAKVERCPFRGGRSDCKCNGYRKCAKGRGRRGDVTLNHCIDCVAAGGP